MGEELLKAGHREAKVVIGEGCLPSSETAVCLEREVLARTLENREGKEGRL